MFINMNSSPNISTAMFFSELMKLSTDIVWKNQMLANRYEDQDNYLNAEMFIAATRNILSFESVYQFDYAILILAGLSNEQALAGMDSKETIPEQFRDICISKFTSYILEKNNNTGKYVNYEEKNNYYRMLYGLPDTDDTAYLYNTLYDDISKEIPIHELNINERYSLENRGYIDTLITEYPDKKYLKHLTSKCIDPYLARSAERFSILWMNGSDFNNLLTDFKSVYEDCRMNIIKVYYTEAFRKQSEYYDSFLAMCILFMTIQLMHYKYLDNDLTRDFYDLDSIKYIYNAYSVPFYSDIPLSFHTKIVKKLNTLLSYKGSSKVFFDLFELFDYGYIEIFNYYLLKTHKFDVNNKPIFIKNIDDSYDYPSMYDIKFAKVKLYDNIQMEISNPANHVDYNTMTESDPYWVSDSELMDKLYSTQFNYLESKYIGLQIIFDLTKIMYESSFFFKALLDNKSAIANLSVYLPAISSSVKLFNIIIYLCSLICKKYSYEGNISSKLPIVSKILGFNFKDDLSTIRNDIVSNDYLKDDTELLDLLVSMDMSSIVSINTTLERISSLQTLLTRRKFEAVSRHEFFAYYNLEKTLMTSDFIEEIYEKSDGDTATSFSDLLSDVAGDLYLRLNSTELDITNEIDNVINLLIKTFSTLDYLNYSDIQTVHVMMAQLFKLLYFFKSAKSELVGYNIIYTFSSRNANMIKLLDQINSQSITVNIDEADIFLEDDIHIRNFLLPFKDKTVSIYDLATSFLRYLINEDNSYTDALNLVNLSFNIDENNNALTDSVRIHEIYDTIKDKDIDMTNTLTWFMRYLDTEDNSYVDRILSVIFSSFTFDTKEYDLLKNDDINITSLNCRLADSALQNDSLTLIHESIEEIPN